MHYTRKGKFLLFSSNEVHSRGLNILTTADDIPSRVLMIRLTDTAGMPYWY